MFGKIIDLNSTDAFVEISNSFIINIPLNSLPLNSSVGDSVNLSTLHNKKDTLNMSNFF
ncbi:hypothetical protein [Clostridium senegalense]|uniref:hypothetical protein n=1 Tax=Clostridium senegalense TaxID=1465809 RepID=UPI0013B41117|nr:hypothetical protein [Clostridium senegalense]